MQPANPINERYPELVEMLLSDNIDIFKQRLQSFVNQIPDNKRSVSKEGFFPLFSLASFLALPDTVLGRKLGVKEVFLRVEKAGIVKGVKLVVLVQKPQCGTSKQEQDKLIFIECFDTQEGRLPVPNVHFSQEEINYLSNRIENYQNLKKQGYSVSIKHTENPATHTKNMLIETPQFTTNLGIKGGHNLAGNHFVVKKHENNIEHWVSRLSSEDRKEVEDNAKKIFKYFGQEVHKHLVQNLEINFAKEYEYHGLLTGFFVMLFKYHHNLKCYIELSLGEGFADIVILVREAGRSLNTIPVVVELKKGRTDISYNDKDQAKKYADAFWYGPQRMITNNKDIVYSVFNCDLEEDKRLWIQSETKNTDHQPFSRLILQTTDIARIQEQLKYIYYSIPNGVENYYHYSTEMLLGQLIASIQTPEEKSWKKHVFKYGQEVLLGARTAVNISGDIATFGFINPEHKMLVLLNITRSNARPPIPEDRKVKIESIIGENSNIKITEVSLKLKMFTKGDKKKFEDWCKGQDQGIKIESFNHINEYNNKYQSKFQGEFSSLENGTAGTNSDNLNTALRSAVNVMRRDTIEIDDAQHYVKLFKEIAKYLLKFKDSITSEADFQAVVQGVFSHYSDSQFQSGNNERISVVPEMQSGGGCRVDIGLVGKKVFIGIELKYDNTTGEPQKNKITKDFDKVSGIPITTKAREAENQLARYKEQPNNIKSLTDGDDAAMLWAVFHKGATTAESLIEVRSEFDTFPVVHSSMHVIQQLIGDSMDIS